MFNFIYNFEFVLSAKDGRRVIVNYACYLSVLVPRLCLLPLYTHPEYTIAWRSVLRHWVYFGSSTYVS